MIDYKTLLPDYPKQDIDMSNVTHKGELLEAQLENFGIKADVVSINPGPVITQYELKLGKGTKAAEISNLSQDIAIALKAKSIRILTPIPGKGTIGVEIPNDDPQTVYIKDVMEHTDVSNMKIPIVLGKSVTGEYKVTDLAKAPHLLMAGSTGSGKSVGINSFLTSILLYKTPEEVRLLLIDPKVVELTPYQNAPHTIGDVITDPNDAVNALKWAVEEMDNRYKLLAENKVRNIDSFNQLDQGKMAYIVVVIDELSDLMMTTGKQVEEYIVRIAQKARAIGIHLILTTQRPDIKVITGLIKANLPTRIGFKVASQTDAKIIMDGVGCEKLLGKGDMLFKNGDGIERIHGAYVTDTETNMLVNAICKTPKIKIVQDKPVEDIKEHPKYDEAVKLMKVNNRMSASFIQRHLDIDYESSQLIVENVKMLSS